MEAYRDQYAKLFHNGDHVVVLAVSTDPDTALFSWARDAHFPMLFGSDTDMAVGTLYGADNAKNHIDLRYLFVIGPDGRITHRMVPFNVLSAADYKELAAAVDSAAGPPASGTH